MQDEIASFALFDASTELISVFEAASLPEANRDQNSISGRAPEEIRLRDDQNNVSLMRWHLSLLSPTAPREQTLRDRRFGPAADSLQALVLRTGTFVFQEERNLVKQLHTVSLKQHEMRSLAYFNETFVGNVAQFLE